MTKSKKTFQNAVLFFLEKGRHPTLGKVKLAKLLFLADAIAYQNFKKTITGKDYIKLPLGPVPEDFDVELSEMEDKKLISKSPRYPYLNGQEFYINRESACMDVFTQKEKAILNEVLAIFHEKYTKELVEISHKLLPWDIIDIGEKISFELYGLSNEEALQLKIKAKQLTTTEIIMNSPDLIASFEKGREDVRRNRVKEHKWV